MFVVESAPEPDHDQLGEFGQSWLDAKMDDPDSDDTGDAGDTSMDSDLRKSSQRVAKEDDFVLADGNLRPWSWESDLFDSLHPGWSQVDSHLRHA